MFAAVYIPNFYLQAALRHEPKLRDQPVVLLAGEQNELERAAVLQCTERACASGVQPGFTSSQAKARCPQIIFRLYSAVAVRSATDVLLQTVYAFSPNIELTSDGVCTIDLRGLPFADDAARKTWAEKIRAALAQFHIHATIGFATTPGLALLAARATDLVLIATDTHSFVSTLPIQSLNPDPEVSSILHRWGIHTVGALLALGKEQIAERLGAPALELFERVSPDCVRPLKIVRPSESFEEEMDFEVVIETAEPLLFVLRRFVEQLAARIALTYRVISELELRLTLGSGALYERTFKIPAPTSRVETLFRMLHTHLENLRTDAPIVSLRLRATPCLDGNHQFGLFESALRDLNQFHETLARLTALLGANRVGTPVREASRKPDAFRMEAPQFGTTEIQKKPAHIREVSKGPSLRRFRPRVRAMVELHEKDLLCIYSAAFTGAICDQRGPFGISGEGWWENISLRRLEWDAQVSDGTLYRLVRQDGEWFVEGVYD